MEAASRAMEHATRKMEEASRAAAQMSEEPPRKRPHVSPEEERGPSHAIPNTHIKITSRSEYRNSIQWLYYKLHLQYPKLKDYTSVMKQKSMVPCMSSNF